MKVFATFLSLFILSFIQAQSWDFSAPDYATIEEACSDDEGEFFYPNLISRYTNADTTLSLEELRHVYYGYTFRAEYSPYGHSEYKDSIRTVLNGDSLSFTDTNTYHRLSAYCDSALQDFPFDLKALSYKLWALENSSDSASYNETLWQHNAIVEVLISSGDGVAPETAFYVIKTSHEYYLLNVFDFEFGGQQSLIGECDKLKLAENEFGLEGLYFNVSPCLNHLNSMFEDDED